MKFQLLTVLVVVAGAFALPRSSGVVVAESSNQPIQRVNVEGGIRSIFEFISSIIRLLGLDPLNVVGRRDFEFSLPGTDGEIKGFVENLHFSGIGNFRIHTLNYNHFFNRLRLDFSLPQISLRVGDSSLEGSVNGKEIQGQVKGSLLIKSIRLASEVHVHVGFGGSITVRSVSVNFSLGGIESDLTVVAQGNDISDDVNQYLGEGIPSFVDDNRNEINTRIEAEIRRLVNRIFNP